MRPEYRKTRSARAVPTQQSIAKSKDTKILPTRTGSLPPNVSADSPIKSATLDFGAKKQVRHRMTDEQLSKLEALYSRDTHPSTEDKLLLGKEINLEVKTVSVWFQNKRQTDRKAGRLSPSSSSSTDNAFTQSALNFVTSPSKNATLYGPARRYVPREGIRQHKPLAPASVPKALHSSENSNSPSVAALDPPATVRSSTDAIKNSTGFLGKTSQDISLPLSLSGSDNSDWTISDSPSSQDSSGVAVTLAHGSNVFVDGGVKRSRTLEWACDRQAKRRRSIQDEQQLPSPASKDGVQNVSPHASTAMKAHQSDFDSAMSLLALPGTSATTATLSEDVVHGASLLLFFKYSMQLRHGEERG